MSAEFSVTSSICLAPRFTDFVTFSIGFFRITLNGSLSIKWLPLFELGYDFEELVIVPADSPLGCEQFWVRLIGEALPDLDKINFRELTYCPK